MTTHSCRETRECHSAVHAGGKGAGRAAGGRSPPELPSRVPEGAPEPRAAPGCGSPVGIPGRCALFSVPSRGPASWCRDDELKREKRFPPPQRPRFQRWGRGGVAAQRLHVRGAGREAQGGPGVRAAVAASAGGDGPCRRGSPLQQPSARFPRGSLVSPSPRSPGSSWSSFSMATLEQLPGPLLLFEGRTASAALRWLPEVFYGARRQSPFF